VTAANAQTAARAAADSMKPPAALIDTIPIPAITPDSATRFLAKVRVSAVGCWDWTGHLDLKGYGRFSIGGRKYYPYRVTWSSRNGPIPAGYTLDHLCRNTSCVNPDHLDPKTGRDNTLAGDTLAADNAARDACPRGHALIGANLTPADLRRGKRDCRICHVVRSRARLRVLRSGGTVAEANEAATVAVAVLTGDETPASVGIPPMELHYLLGLVDAQMRFADLAVTIGASR